MNIKSELLDFQRSTVSKLEKLEEKYDGGMLFSSPGTGKSICILSLMSKIPLKTLIICPAGLIENWNNEILKHTDMPKSLIGKFHGPGKTKDLSKCTVVITSYSSLSDKLDVSSFGRIVLDEAHYIRNSTNKTTKKIDGLFDFEVKKWIITATPLFNSKDDYYSYFKFLNIEGMDDRMTWNQTISNDLTGIRTLNSWVKKYSVLYEKKQVLKELPVKNEVFILLNFNKEEEDFYDALKNYSVNRIKLLLKNEKIKDIWSISRQSVLVHILRLKQACNNYVLIIKSMKRLRGVSSIQEATKNINYFNQSINIKEECPICYDSTCDFILSPCGHKYCKDCIDKMSKKNISKCPVCRQQIKDFNSIENIQSENSNDNKKSIISSKMKALYDLYIKITASNEKMIIVSQWVSMIDLVIKFFNDKVKKFKYCKLQGSVKFSDRMKEIEKFQNDGSYSVCFISLTSSSEGINLTSANHLVHLDQWWNNAKMEQCSDRIHRIGQKKQVTIYKFQIENTIEQKIQMIADNKQMISTTITGNEARVNKFNENWLIKQVIK